MSDEGLDEQIYIRISTTDREQLRALAARMPLKEAAIARIAMRIGLAELERDPARIFTAAKPTKGKR